MCSIWKYRLVAIAICWCALFRTITSFLSAETTEEMHEALTVNRGFQHLNTHRFNHQIRCVAQQAAESAAVHCTIGSEHITSVCSFKQHQPQNKYSVSEGISQLIYIKKYRLYIAFCLDLTLRVFSEHFELIETVHITATVLSLTFNDATSELYSGGVGCITTWQLRHQLHNPLVPGKALVCSVGQQQWVVSLDLDVCTEKLVAACQDAVYIIDTQAHKQCNAFINGHKASITSALLYAPLEYLISAAKDGSIKVWNCLLHSEVHTFTGHLKAVTGLKAHPLAPCVVSCSLDGTVRTWHLESMTESYRLDCGEQLLGLCSDYPLGNRMVCHANQSIRMWVLNRLEVHFASVNSSVISMIRSESGTNSQPARILALAEDGGVRLLSPVTGQVITILFPMFSSQILCEAVYSRPDSLLFALLRTGEVLVVTTLTNPCSARQLWVPRQKDSINCLALTTVCAMKDGYLDAICAAIVPGASSTTECTVTTRSGGTRSLVFGGQSCGHISLLHGGGVSMPHPCPAHAGHVTKLASSTNPIPPSSNSPALVSFGGDNMLNVWSVHIETKGNICLKLQMSISMELCPTHVGLLYSTLCLALADNKIIMLNATPESRLESQTLAPTQSLANFPMLYHQTEDDHTDKVTSLSCSSHLKLFATSSKDGWVKIWSLENQLVSDIYLGPTLASVCFASPRGDLLVGFQQHIYIVQAEDCLPGVYIEIARHCLHQDRDEEPMPFDPTLEFWYDPSRVPSLPAQEDKRKRLLAPQENKNRPVGFLAHAKAPEYKPRNNMEIDNQCGDSDTASNNSVEGLRVQSSHLVDSRLARQLSQQYFDSLMEQPSTGPRDMQPRSGTDQLPPTSTHESYSGITITERDDTSVPSSPQCSHGPDSFPASTELPGVKSGSSFHALLSSSLPCLAPPLAEVITLAEVMPLQSSSCRFPIAPDCLIPNSILRSKLGYIPPEVTIPVQRPKAVVEQRPSLELQESTEEVGPVPTEVEQEFSVAGKMTDREEMVTYMSELLDSEYGEMPVNLVGSDHEVYNCTPSTQVTEKQTRGAVTTFAVHEAERTCPVSDEVEGGTQREVDPNMLESQHTRELAQMETARRRRPSATHSGSTVTTPPRGIPALESGCTPKTASSTPGYTLHEFSPWKSRGQSGHCTGVHTSKSSAGAAKSCRPDTSRSSHTMSDGSKTSHSITTAESKGNLITGISSKPWFPRGTNSPSLKFITETLLSLLKTSRMPVFGDVCSCLVELKEAELLSSDQQLAVVCEVVVRLESKTHSLKVTALKTVGQFGLGGKEELLVVLPLLTDPDVQIRSAAFSVVKRLTGIVNRSQLHQLLIELGLLQNVLANEDEIFSDLAARIQRGQVKSQAHTTNPLQSSDSTRTENKVTRSPATALKLPKLQHKNGACTNNKQHHAKEDPSRTVCFPARTDSTQAVESTTQQPSQAILTTPHAHLKLISNQYHKDLKLTPNYFVQSYKYSNRLSHPAVNSRYSHPAANIVSTTSSSTNRLHQLIAQNPTSFSQMEPTVKMMLRAYGGSKDDKPILAEDYTWSEVFPVMRPARKWSGHRRAFSLPAVLDPLLPKADSEKNGPRLQRKDRVVKLPKIITNKNC